MEWLEVPGMKACALSCQMSGQGWDGWDGRLHALHSWPHLPLINDPFTSFKLHTLPGCQHVGWYMLLLSDWQKVSKEETKRQLSCARSRAEPGWLGHIV